MWVLHMPPKSFIHICCLFTTSSVKRFVVNAHVFVYNCVFLKKEKQHSQNLSHLKMKAH